MHVLLWTSLACTPPAPSTSVASVDADRSYVASRGLLFTTLLVGGEGWAMLVDGKGQERWSQRAPSGWNAARVRRSADGTVVVGLYDPEDELGVGRIERHDVFGGRLSRTDAPTLHHDVVDLEDGRFAHLGHVTADVDVPPFGVLPLVTDTVRVTDEEGDGDEVFSLLEDYPVAPYWTCGHMVRDERIVGYNEWTHSNSLVPWNGGWLLMPRWLDSLVALDGAFRPRWVMGGVAPDIGDPDEPLFQHAHMSWAEGNRILVFDNGYNHPVLPASRVVEIEIDEVAMTARQVWSYSHPQGGGTSFLGDAKRLPNGNTLIAWGGVREVTEVTPEGEVVWKLDVQDAVGRVEVWEGPLP